MLTLWYVSGCLPAAPTECPQPPALPPPRRPAGENSLRAQRLRELGVPWRLLLTGTPLQARGLGACSSLDLRCRASWTSHPLSCSRQPCSTASFLAFPFLSSFPNLPQNNLRELLALLAFMADTTIDKIERRVKVRRRFGGKRGGIQGLLVGRRHRRPVASLCYFDSGRHVSSLLLSSCPAQRLEDPNPPPPEAAEGEGADEELAGAQEYIRCGSFAFNATRAAILTVAKVLPPPACCCLPSAALHAPPAAGP